MSLYLVSLNIYQQALMDSNLPRLQLELYKEIKKVICWLRDVFSDFIHT